MPQDKYATLKLDKKIIYELDELLKNSGYKSRADFIYQAIKELMEVTRIKNSLNPSGHVYFRDLLLKKRIEAYNETKEIHGTKYTYYSGQEITPKGEISTVDAKKKLIQTKPAIIVKKEKLVVKK